MPLKSKCPDPVQTNLDGKILNCWSLHSQYDPSGSCDSIIIANTFHIVILSPSLLVILSPSLIVILSAAKNLIPLRINSAKDLQRRRIS